MNTVGTAGRDYHRGWVGWGGPVFWPYAYDDVFDYAFWPSGPYDDPFWSYGYDDLFAGILLPFRYSPWAAVMAVRGYAPGRPAFGRRRRPTLAV